MIPEQLAACGTERGHQMALFAWAAMNQDRWPQLRLMFHIQNASANKSAKAIGVKAGVPDVMLPVVKQVPIGLGHCTVMCAGLFIELKKPFGHGTTAGKMSDEQKKWFCYLEDQGYRCVACWGWEQARDAIVAYLSQ